MTSIDETSRTATEADLPSLVELARAAERELRPRRGGSVWSRLEARVEPIEEGLAADVADPDVCTVVGCLDGATVGYGVTRLVDLHDGSQIGRVTDVYVLPDARGVGVGEAMMNHMLDWAGERGCEGVDSLALPGDRDTKNFFETHGLVARAIIVHRSLSDSDERSA